MVSWNGSMDNHFVYYFLSGFMEWMDYVCENGEISCCEVSPFCIISCVVFLCCGSPSICNWMDNLSVMGLAITYTQFVQKNPI